MSNNITTSERRKIIEDFASEIDKYKEAIEAINKIIYNTIKNDALNKLEDINSQATIDTSNAILPSDKQIIAEKKIGEIDDIINQALAEAEAEKERLTALAEAEEERLAEVKLTKARAAAAEIEKNRIDQVRTHTGGRGRKMSLLFQICPFISNLI